MNKTRIVMIIGLMLIWLILGSTATLIHLNGPTPNNSVVVPFFSLTSLILGLMGGWAIGDLYKRK